MTKLTKHAAMVALLAAPGLCFAQALSGTVLASDTGKPIPGAVVLAVGVTSSPSQPPVIYQTKTDSHGNFTMSTTAGGQYRLCASGGSYLNPCLWGGAPTVAPGASAVTLRLQKGALFIARVHTSTQMLSQTEAVHGSAIAAQITGGPFARFPLPLLYESASARDYGDVLPLNLAMTLQLTSQLSLTDSAGAPVAAQGVPLAITSTDFAPTAFFDVKFGGAPAIPAAKILHFYANP